MSDGLNALLPSMAPAPQGGLGQTTQAIDPVGENTEAPGVFGALLQAQFSSGTAPPAAAPAAGLAASLAQLSGQSLPASQPGLPAAALTAPGTVPLSAAPPGDGGAQLAAMLSAAPPAGTAALVQGAAAELAATRPSQPTEPGPAQDWAQDWATRWALLQARGAAAHGALPPASTSIAASVPAETQAPVPHAGAALAAQALLTTPLTTTARPRTTVTSPVGLSGAESHSAVGALPATSAWTALAARLGLTPESTAAPLSAETTLASTLGGDGPKMAPAPLAVPASEAALSAGLPATGRGTDALSGILNDGALGTTERKTLDLNLPTSMDKPQWRQAFNQHIVMLAKQDIQSARIRINPPHLGVIEVRVNVHHDSAQVAFSSQHGVVREALEGALPRLREMFNEQGLNLTQADVSDQTPNRNERRGEQGHGGAAGWGWDDAEAAEEDTVAAPLRPLDGLVDDYA